MASKENWSFVWQNLIFLDLIVQLFLDNWVFCITKPPSFFLTKYNMGGGKPEFILSLCRSATLPAHQFTFIGVHVYSYKGMPVNISFFYVKHVNIFYWNMSHVKNTVFLCRKFCCSLLLWLCSLWWSLSTNFEFRPKPVIFNLLLKIALINFTSNWLFSIEIWGQIFLWKPPIFDKPNFV